MLHANFILPTGEQIRGIVCLIGLYLVSANNEFKKFYDLQAHSRSSELPLLDRLYFPTVVCNCNVFISCTVYEILPHVGRGATMAGKLRIPKFGSKHRDTCAPRLATGLAGDTCGRGSPLTLWWSGGITPGKFVKTQMLNTSCILVTTALISGLPGTCCNDKVLKLFGRRVGLCVEWSDVNGVQVCCK